MFSSASYFDVQLFKTRLHSQKRHRLVASCQFYRLVATGRQVATNLLKSGLLQLVICRLVTICWKNLQQVCWNNQLGTSLLTTFNKFVDNLKQTCCHKLSVASDANASWYRLVVTSCYKMSTDLLQDVNRLVTAWAFLDMYVLLIQSKSWTVNGSAHTIYCYLG